MSVLYIQDESYTEKTTSEPPENEDPYYRDSTHTTHSIQGISLKKRGSRYNETLELDYQPDADALHYLVYALYSTGDSFGHDSGRIEFIDLFKTESDANDCHELLKKAKDGSARIKSGGGKAYTFSVPWIGYFDRLESIEIESFNFD